MSSIEFAQIQAAVVHGLEEGSAVLKQLQSEFSLERVERLMDESQEGIAYQREIDEALMSKMSPEEEEAVNRELEELEREQMVCLEAGRAIELGYDADASLRSRTSQTRRRCISRMCQRASPRRQRRRWSRKVG